MQKALVLAGALALALPNAVTAHSTTPNMSFAFGRSGGNIAPFAVMIGENGEITTSGPAPQPLKRQLSAASLTRLAALVTTQHFFALPHSTQCAGELPDFAFSYATVTTRLSSRTVRVRGDCSPRFNRIYVALTNAVR